MTKSLVPNPGLRAHLVELGIPAERHDVGSLLGLIPVNFTGDSLREFDVDSLAEGLIYLIRSGVIQVPMTAEKLTAGLPWGTHLCHFYRRVSELTELLVPFFKAGLEANEYGVWVVTKPLTLAEARNAMGRAVPEKQLEQSMEFLDGNTWYRNERGGVRDPEEILRAWAMKEAEARRRGFNGLRITGDVAWACEPDLHNDFMSYERAAHNALPQSRVKALCTYPIHACQPSQISDVVERHEDTVVKKSEWWHRISNRGGTDASQMILALKWAV